MKAATGELNLTLITVVAIGLLTALFMGTLWPAIKGKITDGWSDTEDQLPEISYYNANYDFPNFVDSELF